MFLSVILLAISTVSGKSIPPSRNHSHDKIENVTSDVGEAFHLWTPESPYNLWEVSGQLEGDIVMDTSNKNTLLNPAQHWPGGIVPYFISHAFDKEERLVIFAAMRAIETSTCIRFRPREGGDEAYLEIGRVKESCTAQIGYGVGKRDLNLGKTCMRRGIIIHELLHTLGVFHQHSASDRNDYVTIHWDNILTGEKHNFVKYSKRKVNDYGVGYDYDSIMHYSAFAFSKNKMKTITPKDESVTLGYKAFLSEKDVKKLKLMYNCYRRNT